MKHFGLEAWADFARGAATADRAAAMERHLSEGCQKCSKALGLWRQVSQAAKAEAAYEPPASAVRAARAHFDFQQAPLAVSPAWAPKLLWDSLLHAAPAGFRTAAAAEAPRQILYGAGNLRIDLTLQPQMGSEKWVLIGQVLDTGQPLRSVSEVLAVLREGSQEAGRALTNRFGEFRLEFDPVKELTLSVLSQPGNEVLIPIHPLGKQGDARDKR